jgi:Mrp family chromosome partitioning ATPase
MERIAKAIELARQSEAGQRLSAPPPERAAAPRPARTRTVQLAPELLRSRHISGGQERSELAMAFKRLRTQILQRQREAGANTLGVISAHAGEGRTTTAINLAVHTSMEVDWTVLLVDADLRTPGACKTLGLPELPGLSEYLTQNTPLEELLVRTDFARFVLLPAGAPPQNASEVLGSTRMLSLVDELKHRYPDRLVIFDVPPVVDSPEGLALLPWLETVLLVVEEGRTPAEDAVRAAQLAGKSHLIGTVLNKSRALSSSSAAGEPWLARVLRRWRH